MSSIARPRFLERIEAHDFKAVAAKGCFVYCYLRTTDGSPYYVGIAKNPLRPTRRHTTTVPKERARIRILRSGLAWEQACEWERRYIARWGRRDNGTGILHNLTDGGEGAPGVMPSPETRAKMSAMRAGRPLTAYHAAQISAALKGRPVTEEWRAKLSAANKGKTLTAEHRAKISAGGKGLVRSAETRARISAANKGKTLSAEHRAKISDTKKARRIETSGQDVSEAPESRRG